MGRLSWRGKRQARRDGISLSLGERDYSLPEGADHALSTYYRNRKRCHQPFTCQIGKPKLLDGRSRKAGSGTLLVPGNWYTGRDYNISGVQVSRSGFAALFIRAYRDCAIRDSQGACKSIPDLFVGLLNAGMAQGNEQPDWC
jgi:hypothetical protein